VKRHGVLVFVFLAAFITYLDRVCISVAAPSMQKDLGLSAIEMGWVFTAFYVAYAIFEIPAAWAGDRWGQRRTLIRIVGGWSIFTMLTGTVRSYATLLLVRFFFGAAESGAFPTLSRSLSRWFPAHERGFANGLMWTGARLGGAVSPALAVLAMAWVGWRGAFLLFGLVGLVWVAACAIWFRDAPADAPVATTGPLPWKQLLFNRDLLILCATYFASGFGFQFFVTWLPTYLTREHGLTLARSGIYASLPLLAGALGCALGGLVSDWITRRSGSLLWGRRIVGAGGFLLGAAGFLAAVSARSPELAVACLAFASGAHDLTLPVVWATCTDLGGRFGGTAGGWMNLASSLSGMLAPVASAGLAQWFGSFHAVFWVTILFYLAGALLWLFIDPRKPAIS
jgi:ACS family glucarate transporter-like MFS transporter